MAGFTNLAETDFLDLFFTNVAFPNVGDAAGLPPSVATDGAFDIALHTGDAITDASTVLTDNEADYIGYSRPSYNRGTATWTVTGDTASNDVLIAFGEMSSGASDTITDTSIGFATASVMQIWGQVTADLVVNIGVNPQLAINALDVTID
jgi:hypothetical protein